MKTKTRKAIFVSETLHKKIKTRAVKESRTMIELLEELLK